MKLFKKRHKCKFGNSIVEINGVKFRKCINADCNGYEPIEEFETNEELINRLKKKYPNSKILNAL